VTQTPDKPGYNHRQFLKTGDPVVYNALAGEEARQADGVELIPSENYTYPEVLAVLGSVFTNKYSEGYPGRRYYGGQEYTDIVEELARDRARRLFRAEHVNVQPLSGSPMNQAAYFACLSPGDTILAMDLSHGGHLTHGAPVSHMGKVFRFVRYRTRTDRSGAIDFDELGAIAREHRPKLVLCGHSSYPRELDYAAFKRVADDVGALTMADISHVGGLVAGGVSGNPLDVGFDIVTTTTHKSLRGPRGGLILCRGGLARSVDSSVFPGLQGGPHMNAVAGAAITFGKALQPEFRQYARQVCNNARVLASGLLSRGATLVTGGTDNHLMVVDAIASFGVDGHEAERALDRVGITTNKQIIPDDTRPPLRPSGVRLGTPACTTRGMRPDDMEFLASAIVEGIVHRQDERRMRELQAQVRDFCARFPVPGMESDPG